MSNFWSAWIIFLTVATIVGSTWLLMGNRKGRGEGQTTGHVYDDIEEYDNPLPAWWLYMFLASIVFAIGYLIAYPGLGKFPGMLGWTQVEAWQSEIDKAERTYAPLFEGYLAQPVETVAQDPKATKMGQRLFAHDCAQCPGSDARGSHGFPNLTDNDWLYGGDAATIQQSIAYGRAGQMPAWGAVMGDEKTAQATAYVQSLSGQDTDAALAEAGKAVYGTYCIACHGVEGKGNPMFGAPNLTDDIWLYGGSESQIRRSIANGRQGQMPAHKDLLDEARIHLITAYVYSLSQKPIQAGAGAQ